jgi:hypothetical protein
MRQFTVVAIAGAIAVAISSCASEEASVVPSPSPAASAPAAAPGAAPAAGTQKFSKPLVAQKPGAVGTVPGLIQSTNGDERAKQVQTAINTTKAGKDPFTGLPPLLPKVNITARNPVPVPSAPATGGRSTSPKIGFRAPTIPPRTKSVPTAPTPPSTTLASAVEVSGVVTVNGVTQAIIKAPNEDTSRYVSVGQRLSNGQVLVKRIDTFPGSEPVVILEQNGVEVARIVGDKPIVASGGNAPQETAPPPATKPAV